jgi:uncharacterized protein YecE (DUF72 family)
MGSIRIGTAGWSIARVAAERFPAEGSSLERYAATFGAVEVNSSFHRPHRVSTWVRWRDSVPADFRFSVKVPKRITHELKLVGYEEARDTFLDEAGALNEKLAVLAGAIAAQAGFRFPNRVRLFLRSRGRNRRGDSLRAASRELVH